MHSREEPGPSVSRPKTVVRSEELSGDMMAQRIQAVHVSQGYQRMLPWSLAC